MRFLIAVLWLASAGSGIAVAEAVPLPRPRPPIWIEPQSFREAAGPDFDSGGVTSEPTECDKRILAIAVTEPLPRLVGPDACGGSDMLRLMAALRPDGTRIEIKPVAAPRVDKLGAPLRTVETFDDFECRGRNRVVGAKLSEHGKGNAVDVRSFVLADGRSIGLTDISVAKDFREGIRDSACHRFTTVLGPGADAQHESHIHLDLIERTQGYRMCQWDVREPAKTEVAAQVPLPPPRPAVPVAR